ncbi:MAG: preprotein translocase subunit SecG [SAR86 cluster bacterium]|uniref:Protein-export membrane protein SecG n=1 Tax=SAR86 cluster bacterium TaxID=2030880 RepID=A0A520MSM5_9GAMM|nr:MAG: preprotein translocase subunit SecG [SAR86 cluster bacterium]
MLIKIALVILAVLIVGSIMLQQGKGSDLGSAFGGGSSDSLFGPLGPSNFFSKLTWGLITVFFVLCLLLAYISKQELTLNISDDVIEEVFDEPPVE